MSSLLFPVTQNTVISVLFSYYVHSLQYKAYHVHGCIELLAQVQNFKDLMFLLLQVRSLQKFIE